MDCPYCGKEMREGYIPFVRNHVVWKPLNPADPVGETVALSKFLEDAPAFYCPDCRKVVVDVPEVELLERKVARMMDSFAEKVNDTLRERKACRDAKKECREAEKEKGKDPWE